VWSDDTNNASISLWTGDTSGSPAIVTTMTNDNAEIYTNPLIFDAADKLWIAWTEYNDNNHKIVLVEQEKYDSRPSQ
jgi:hypothetical protein